MSLNIYLFKNNSTSPLVFLISQTSDESDDKVYDKYYKYFYEILLDNEIINGDSILVFCNFKSKEKKRQVQIQGSTKSDNDILKKLDNIKYIESLVDKTIEDYDTDYLIEISDSIEIKNIKKKIKFKI